MKEKYYQFLEWKTKTIRKFAFWLLGWKNIKNLDVTYYPDPYTKVQFHQKPNGSYNTILEVRTLNGDIGYE
jgi:hypothetical protein